jgi:sugar phosphate isomerase/epimerase
MMRIGIFAKTFAGHDPAVVLRAVRDAGYGCTQFNLASADLDAMPAEVPDAVIAAIAGAARETGVSIEALSGTYNMIHPDPAVRALGLERLGVVIAAAARLGVGMVTLCTGTRDPHDQWRAHPDNTAPDAWRDLRAEMGRAAELAERHGVDLGIEPEQANVVMSAADALRLFRDVGSPRLRVVLDPANLFEHESTGAAARIVADAVDLLAGHVGMAHAKDRDAQGRFCTAGTGIVDFPAFLGRLRDTGFDGPVIAHGLTAAEAPGVAALLVRSMPT